MEREKPTFEGLWQRVDTFNRQRPDMRHSVIFHGEKGQEEADELLDAIRHKEHFEVDSESGDVLINWIQLQQARGISFGVALEMVNQKLSELETRYPSSRFDGSNGLSYEQNYAECRQGREMRPSQSYSPTHDIFENDMA